MDAPQPILVTDAEQLERLARRAMATEVIALDTEGNGLHAFRSSLCVMQLGWQQGDDMVVAIVDTLALDISPLAHLLGQKGPTKLLHDLTFDARMLQETGTILGNVRDTSVAARFLGEQATGLAALLSTHLSVELEKKLQDHNWAERPFSEAQLEYLAGDVLYLPALDEALSKLADEKQISGEIAVECAYKLSSALAPPRDRGPAYLRIKGARGLAPLEQAILRRLVLARERIAEQRDVPPFRIGANRLLLELARRKPKSAAAIARIADRRPRFSEHARHWLEAIREGVADGEPPAADMAAEKKPRPSPAEVALRKRIDAALNGWRRQIAEQREVDRQVVVPGHCMAPLVGALLVEERDDALERMRGVEGLCAGRIERYGDAWLELARTARAKS